MDILTPQEAAEFLKINSKEPWRSITLMARDGKIPAKKICGKWRFLKSELIKWLENGEEEARIDVRRIGGSHAA